jgi:hypothetical protein
MLSHQPLPVLLRGEDDGPAGRIFQVVLEHLLVGGFEDGGRARQAAQRILVDGAHLCVGGVQLGGLDALAVRQRACAAARHSVQRGVHVAAHPDGLQVRNKLRV